MRKDLERFLDRQARFAALGDKHLEIVQKSPHPGLGVIEWEPLRSLKNGRELAKGVQPNIDSLRGQIRPREARIKSLLK